MNNGDRRVFIIYSMIEFLKQGSYKKSFFIGRFKIDDRTFYRYMQTIKNISLPLEQDAAGRFYIRE